jgi:hypothetical protein
VVAITDRGIQPREQLMIGADLLDGRQQHLANLRISDGFSHDKIDQFG